MKECVNRRTLHFHLSELLLPTFCMSGYTMKPIIIEMKLYFIPSSTVLSLTQSKQDLWSKFEPNDFCSDSEQYPLCSAKKGWTSDVRIWTGISENYVNMWRNCGKIPLDTSMTCVIVKIDQKTGTMKDVNMIEVKYQRQVCVCHETLTLSGVEWIILIL
jgi:hypothetical protein